MHTLRSRMTRSAVIALASVFALSGVAYADGLKSQWKTRMPLPTGLVKIEKALWRPFFPEKKVLVTQSVKASVPRLVTQRRERLQKRVVQKELSKSVRTNTVTDQPVSTFTELDKIRSIKRTIKPANKCATLHTHEKARCQRDLTYQRTNQYRTHVATKTLNVNVAFVR